MSARNNPPGWRDDGTCPGWPTGCEVWPIDEHGQRITITTDDQQGG